MKRSQNPNSWLYFRSITKARSAAVGLATLLLGTFVPQNASAVSAAVFGREELFTLNSTDVSSLKNSGFTTVILFVVDVESNGDLNYNGDHLIVQNGVYIGDSGWPARLASLKAPPTSIYRIEVCTGGSGAQSWVNIKNLIASQGTGSGSILYKNFNALKNALGVDAICNDDEVQFDANSAAAFGNMIGSLGMKATLCPYNNQTYWQSVKSQLGGNCDAIYLQCYDGGAGNDPASWNTLFGGLKVTPGTWNNDSASTVQSKMDGWRTSSGTNAGFMWQLESIGNSNLATYASAVINGIQLHSGTYTIANDNSGLSLAPEAGGTGNGTQLVQYHLSSSNDFQWNLTYQSALGFWEISGVHSGRATTISGNSMTNSAPIVLWDYTADHNQLFALVNKPAGYFRCQFVHSGLSMVVSGASTASGADIVQYNNDNATNAWWQFRQNQIP